MGPAHRMLRVSQLQLKVTSLTSLKKLKTAVTGYRSICRLLLSYYTSLQRLHKKEFCANGCHEFNCVKLSFSEYMTKMRHQLYREENLIKWEINTMSICVSHYLSSLHNIQHLHRPCILDAYNIIHLPLCLLELILQFPSDTGRLLTLCKGVFLIGSHLLQLLGQYLHLHCTCIQA